MFLYVYICFFMFMYVFLCSAKVFAPYRLENTMSDYNFDWKVFESIFRRVYNVKTAKHCYPTYLKIFKYFFAMHHAYMGKPHYYLSTDSVQKCYAAFNDDVVEEAEEEDFINAYKELIDEYFKVSFGQECSYSIQHFVSGQIRELLARNLDWFQ